MFVCSVAGAADYYIDPVSGSDSDDGSSQGDAWDTFAHARGVLSAGDTLYLMDGTFTEGIYLTTGNSNNGTSGNLITYKALNDGDALIENTGDRIIDLQTGVKYYEFEGMVCDGDATSGQDGIVYLNGVSYVNIKRVTGHDAYNDPAGSTRVFIATGTSDHVLFEDCAAWGTGRKMFIIFSGSSDCTLRRCWSNHGGAADNPRDHFNIYVAQDNIVENCIAYSTTEAQMTGFTVNSNSSGQPANNNEFYGNIVIADAVTKTLGFSIHTSDNYDNVTGNKYYHNVAIASKGFQQQANEDIVIENLTMVLSEDTDTYACNETGAKNVGWAIGGTMKNTSFLGDSTDNGLYINSSSTGYAGFTNTYGNYYDFSTDYRGNASAGTGDTAVAPAYNTATYGNGAYLMVPTALIGQGDGGTDQGAEILYQYEDGVLGTDPLWPWPMEGRILAETGLSVTYSTDQGNSETGGIWKTLSGVYDTQAVFSFTTSGSFQ